MDKNACHQAWWHKGHMVEVDNQLLQVLTRTHAYTHKPINAIFLKYRKKIYLYELITVGTILDVNMNT